MQQITYKDVPFFYQEREGATIGIIVIQEWWGINQHVKTMCKRYSESLNAITVTPDFYRGKVAINKEEASHEFNALNWPGAVQDVRLAAEWLASKGCKSIGVVGFCMGGALSLASSVHVPAINAGVCFYGIPPLQLADPINLTIPMQYHFGDKDHSKGFADIEACDSLRDKLEATGNFTINETRHTSGEFVDVGARKSDGSTVVLQEFHRYANGDHAFMNEEAPAYPYNKECAQLAYSHSVSFFKSFL